MRQHSTAKPGKLTKTSRRELVELATKEKLVVGIDLGDRDSQICLLGGQGEILAAEKVATTKTGLNGWFETLPPVRIALEAGTHSPWASRHLQSLGHEVIVANPRQVRMITDTKRKNDRLDAEKLARLARADPKLLSPIEHRSQQAQEDLAQIRVREELVSVRTSLINCARGLTKSFGERLEKCDPDQVDTEMTKHLDPRIQTIVNPVLELVSEVTEKIKEADQRIHEIARRYPQIELLTAIWGVGELTALAFVLTIDDQDRFLRSRQVGAYLGLTPGQSQSGASDPEQRITKEGDRMMRWLLVQCAHCLIRANAPDSDLKRWAIHKAGEMKRNGKLKKKKVIVAVARKLAVLMHHLWVNGEVYDPLYNAKCRQSPVAA